MTTLLFFTGAALVVAGLAMLSLPAALVAGGFFVAAFAVLLEREAVTRRESSR